ncbi:MAG: class I SAM-dependent methyltransferase [Flavipsychrobacter sp.]|nr:class I SAM-dependent methyltransferase [Flavipsychrobacter sp.]
MEHVDWFENWFGSPYYNLLYQNRDVKEAQAFVETLLQYLQPPKSSRMLDIACGEGRYAIQLAEHGHDVVGIDLSHTSILKANKFERENLHFYVHDMRMPFYINYFDYAFNFFTSFGYFASQIDHLNAAKSFAAALKKDGILVMDYLNKKFVQSCIKPEDTIQKGGCTFHIKKSIENGQILKEISFTDAGNKERIYTEHVATFTLADFIALFKEAGLTLTTTFGDYALNSYDENSSPRMIMLFKKEMI